MRLIDDAYYRDHPTAGVLHVQGMLRLQGYHVNVKRVRRLMRLMNLHAIYPKPCLSKGGVPSYIHPYLLRGLAIDKPNQVWSTDISYIPMNGEFMYLYAVMDVYSRYVPGWCLSNTLSAINACELMEECIRWHGKPEIVNSGQGVQYTGHRWQSLLQGHGVQISRDGRGRCKDNIWIERFWRTIKQEYNYRNPTGVSASGRYRGVYPLLQPRTATPEPASPAPGACLWHRRGGVKETSDRSRTFPPKNSE